MIYLKKFETHQDYETYINDRQNLVLPNVSFCEDNRDVHYNPYEEPPFFCKLTFNDGSVVNIEDTVGDGELTSEMTVDYKNECVSAEVGELCTSIGESALDWCSSLTSVTISNSVRSIGANAFAGCTGLTSVTIGSGATSIDGSAFVECGLTSITVDSGNTVYDSRDNCNAIIKTSNNELIVGCQNTVIPNTVTCIGSFSFSFCYDLTSITIPSNVTTIGQNAFYYCTSMPSVTIGNGVTTIGQGAFSYCSNLRSVTVEATTPPTLDSDVFSNNASGRKIYVPSERVEAYKETSGWSDYASDILPIQ